MTDQLNGPARLISSVDKAAQPQVKNSKTNNTLGGNEEFKCNVCDFVAKNKFGLKIHFHKKHSTATFKCFTCDFTCESYSDLCEHNEKYYYSHRQVLNKDYEKHILDEFQWLDEDGVDFLIKITKLLPNMTRKYTNLKTNSKQ